MSKTFSLAWRPRSELGRWVAALVPSPICMLSGYRLRYRVLGAMALGIFVIVMLALTTRAGAEQVRRVPWLVPRAPILVALGSAGWTILVSLRMWRSPQVTRSGAMVRAAWRRCACCGGGVAVAALAALSATWSYRPPHLLALLILLTLSIIGSLVALTLLTRPLRDAAAVARWVSQRPGATL